MESAGHYGDLTGTNIQVLERQEKEHMLSSVRNYVGWYIDDIK